MVKKSKLLTALDAHRGRDYEAEKKKKQVKAAEKRKRERSAKQLENGLVNSDEARENIPSVPANGVGGSFEGFSEEDDEIEHATKTAPESIPQPKESLDVSESEAEPESDVPLSDLEEEDLEDTVPHQRLTINNGPALIASRNRVTVIKHSETPFHYHNSLISKLEPAATTISDPNDDLTRELEFYRIAREASITARALLKSEKVPFTRPTDYFAEMVKSDEHMGRVKKKMYDEAASKKAAEEARRLRDAKKFGKAVQIAKEQERAKEKRQTLDKIKDLKRKRKGEDTGKVNEDADDDLFENIDVEDGPKKDRQGRERGQGTNPKRQKRNEKFGFGGKKRHSKSGDALSTADMRGFSAKKMKGKPSKRPGKSRRAAAK